MEASFPASGRHAGSPRSRKLLAGRALSRKRRVSCGPPDGRRSPEGRQGRTVHMGGAAASGRNGNGKSAIVRHGAPRRSDFAGWSKVAGRRVSTCTGVHKGSGPVLGMAPREGNHPVLEGTTSSAFYRGFLKGLFDSDGSVQGTTAGGKRPLARSNLDTLGAVQRMLARLGIRAHLRKPPGGPERPMPDGAGRLALYPCKDQHELVISKGNMARFAALVGF